MADLENAHTLPLNIDKIFTKYEVILLSSTRERCDEKFQDYLTYWKKISKYQHTGSGCLVDLKSAHTL